MQIATILKAKGTDVFTTSPDTKIIDLCRMLKDKRIGAVVVTGDDGAIAGIISERDIIHGLAGRGAAVLDRRVADLMTAEVVTCTAESTVHDVMNEMTSRRIRHLPVVARDGSLAGMISIGDVVHNRLLELQSETDLLRTYITSG